MTIGFITNDKHLWFEMVMMREAHRFTMPSFDAYFGPFERGGGSSGQAYVGLSEDVRLKIREELRRSLNDTGGPVHVDVEFGFASGRRKLECRFRAGAAPAKGEFRSSSIAGLMAAVS